MFCRHYAPHNGEYLSYNEKIEIGRDVNQRISNVIRNNINRMIEDVNLRNRANKRKSSYALMFIGVGFALQILSLYFQS